MGGKLTLVKSPMKASGIEKEETIPPSSPVLDLSEKEKQIIHDTFATLEPHTDHIGVEIYLRIFQDLPHTKDFFPFRDAEGEDLINHPYFKGHTKRFFNAIRMAVFNLEALEVSLIPNLIHLGNMHNKIDGFKHEYFETFFISMDAIFSERLGKQYDVKTRTAWCKIFRLIVSKVEEGYRDGQKSLTEISQADKDISPSDDQPRECPYHSSDTVPINGNHSCPAKNE